MKKLKLFGAIKIENTTSEENNNILLFSNKVDGILITPLQEYVGYNTDISTLKRIEDIPAPGIVIKRTVIVSDSKSQLKRIYSVENPFVLDKAAKKHEILPIKDPHGREDTIIDDYNYLLNSKTLFKIDKLLPNTSIKLYLYQSEYELFPSLRIKADATLHSIDLLR